MEKSRAPALIEVTLAVIFWGASFVATKVALRDATPVTIVWLRFAMGVMILGIAVIARKQFSFPRMNELFYFALLGFLGITFHQWLQSTGLQTAQATTTAWIVATSPVFIAILGWLILRERLKWGQVAGILLAAFGVILVVTGGEFSFLSFRQFGTTGDRLILISAVNWAVFSTLSRKGLRTHPASQMMLYVMGFGWLFTSVLMVNGSGLQEIGAISLNGWLGIGFLGVFCSGLAYIFWYDALQTLPTAQVGAFLYLEPFVTVVVAAFVLGEALALASLLGGGAILAGVWMVNRK